MDEINFTSAKYMAIDGSNVSIIVVIDGVTSSVPLDAETATTTK